MTSNHPEKLDPALIRPGRIDKTFHLTYMVGCQAGWRLWSYVIGFRNRACRTTLRVEVGLSYGPYFRTAP